MKLLFIAILTAFAQAAPASIANTIGRMATQAASDMASHAMMGAGINLL